MVYGGIGYGKKSTKIRMNAVEIKIMRSTCGATLKGRMVHQCIEKMM